MKKRNGNIRKRNNGVWEGRFYVDGKRKSVYASTYDDVRKKITVQICDVDDGCYFDETNITVGQWLDEWVNDYLDIKDSTLIRYTRDIRLYILPAIGKTRLKDLTATQIQRIYRKCRENGLSSKTIHNLHGVLHEALKKAVQLDLLRKNVSDLCELPKMRKVEMHPLSQKKVS